MDKLLIAEDKSSIVKDLTKEARFIRNNLNITVAI